MSEKKTIRRFLLSLEGCLGNSLSWKKGWAGNQEQWGELEPSRISPALPSAETSSAPKSQSEAHETLGGLLNLEMHSLSSISFCEKANQKKWVRRNYCSKRPEPRLPFYCYMVPRLAVISRKNFTFKCFSFSCFYFGTPIYEIIPGERSPSVRRLTWHARERNGG